MVSSQRVESASAVSGEQGQFPLVKHYVMTEDVDIPLIALDLEVAMIRRQPSVEDFLDHDFPASEKETAR
jgi:hypothetical protein